MIGILVQVENESGLCLLYQFSRRTDWKISVGGENKLDGINCIDYFGELDWKISVGCEVIWMVLTLSIISMRSTGKLVQDEKNLDGFNCIDYLDKIYQLSRWTCLENWCRLIKSGWYYFYRGNNLDRTNCLEYFGELDWKINAGWEILWMVLTVSLISVDLIETLVQAVK